MLMWAEGGSFIKRVMFCLGWEAKKNKFIFLTIRVKPESAEAVKLDIGIYVRYALFYF